MTTKISSGDSVTFLHHGKQITGEIVKVFNISARVRVKVKDIDATCPEPEMTTDISVSLTALGE